MSKDKAPENPTQKEWNDYWWKKVNRKCAKCLHDCKQSYKVDLILCPQFEKQESDK